MKIPFSAEFWMGFSVGIQTQMLITLMVVLLL